MRTLLLSMFAAGLALGVAQAQNGIVRETSKPIPPTLKRTVKAAKLVDPSSFRKLIDFQFVNHDEDEHENPATPRSWNLPSEPNSLPLGAITAGTAVTLGQFWPAIGATGWQPADPTCAVGPSHVAVTANEQIAFYTKTGSQVLSQSLQTFFSRPSGNSVFDPRVLWDRLNQRWIVIADENGSNLGTIDLAVSKSSDPLGGFWVYTINVTQTISGQNYWMDYPGFGYNKDAYIITGNMFGFSSGFNGVQFVVIPKTPTLTGNSFTASYFTDTAGASAQVADVADSTLDRAYCCSVFGASAMRVYAFSNVGSSPTLNMTTVAVPSFGSPAAVPSTPGSLSAVDYRLFEVAYRNGRLVMSHNTTSISGGSTRVRWYEINTNNYPSGAPSLVQSGELLASSPFTYHMGAVNRNGYGDIAAIFTRSSSTTAPEAFAAGRKTSDAAGTMGTPFLLASSAGTGYGSTGTNRWGDYFGVSVDPVDQATFYGVAMVGNASNGWQTVVNSWIVTPPAQLSSVSLTPSTTIGGSNVSGTVTLDSAAPADGYVVSLSVPGGSPATVPATLTVPGGSNTVNFTMTTSSVASNTNVTVTAILRGTTKTATVTLTPRQIQGHVNLGNWSGAIAGTPITIEVRTAGTTTVLDTINTTLDASGNFSVGTTRTGTFDVAIKASHWLKRNTASVSFGTTGASGINASLVNGDIDGDNVVGPNDLNLLRSAFGGNNAAADLDGDGVVGPSDLNIIRATFGQSGD